MRYALHADDRPDGRLFEVGLFTQLVAPLARGNGPAARARAAETVRELAACTERLHAALVRAGLRETLGR